MRKKIVPLTDMMVKNAKPKEKDYKLSDGYGLYLFVNTSGSKLWRFDYTFNGKRRTLSVGGYPAVSLADARQRREDARRLLASGVDPSQDKKSKKAAAIANAENTFESVAREWHGTGEWSDSHKNNILSRLEFNVFPFIGSRSISEIEAPEILALLRRMEGRSAVNSAHRVLTICGQVFRYGVATGKCKRDPSADLKGALKKVTVKPHAAIMDPKEIAVLLRAIDGYSGMFHTQCALKLAPMLLVRPGELRFAEWSEFDLDAAEWNIPVERMKLKLQEKKIRKGQKHLVPLASQAVAILKELQHVTGHLKYLFPCKFEKSRRPMSAAAINGALRRMGYDTQEQMTAHGFRAMARTILDEVLQVRPEFIEHQLAHVVRDPNGRAYNRTTHIEGRRKMMQLWADYLYGLKAGAKVLPLKRVEGE
jgi:integrase